MAMYMPREYSERGGFRKSASAPTLASGEMRTVAVRQTAPAETAPKGNRTVTVRLLQADGTPMSNARVQVFVYDEQGGVYMPVAQGVLDANGAITLRDLVENPPDKPARECVQYYLQREARAVYSRAVSVHPASGGRHPRGGVPPAAERGRPHARLRTAGDRYGQAAPPVGVSRQVGTARLLGDLVRTLPQGDGETARVPNEARRNAGRTRPDYRYQLWIEARAPAQQMAQARGWNTLALHLWAGADAFDSPIARAFGIDGYPQLCAD
jgi:hypothetical protein